jgi:hypothetical protein
MTEHDNPEPGPDAPKRYCDHCGSDQDVHEGVCHRCREQIRGPRVLMPPKGRRAVPRRAPVRPPHDQPWVPRG